MIHDNNNTIYSNPGQGLRHLFEPEMEVAREVASAESPARVCVGVWRGNEGDATKVKSQIVNSWK